MNKPRSGMPRFRPSGDRGLLVEFGDHIHLDINRKVLALSDLFNQSPPQGVIEVIPAYRSLLIIYDPAQTKIEDLRSRTEALAGSLSDIKSLPSKLVEIPVCYGGEFGPDLSYVAEANRLTQEEVIQLHSAVDYPIFMIGFTPGYPYLGGLSNKLHTPRLKTPRTHVPAGSVAIANNQTGIYSVEAPGGWQLIGRTPLSLFAPERENPFLYDIGDRIRFLPISAKTYGRMADEGSH